MGSKEPVEIACELLYENDRSMLINDGSGEEFWIPKSQLLEHDFSHGVAGSITIPEWLAYEKGLI